jgi:hypothetical protein
MIEVQALRRRKQKSNTKTVQKFFKFFEFPMLCLVTGITEEGNVKKNASAAAWKRNA